MPATDWTSVMPSLVVLGFVAMLAAVLTRLRPSPAGRQAERAGAARTLAVATAVQAAHFGEEWASGFHERFPALAGLAPMPLTFFVAFNVAWLLLWLLAIPGLRAGHAAAFFAAWFLALAAVLNGLAHPLMALTVGGYFPGLYTSPLIAVAGFVLYRRLSAAAKPATAW